MDLGSIENKTRHIKDVRRIESDHRNLTPEEINNKLEEKMTQASIKWEACLKSFALLFVMLNRGNGNKVPTDRFDVRVKHEEYDGATYDTYVKLWRDRRDDSYHVKSYVDLGSDIIDAQYDSESFGSEYRYSYGTHHARSATVQFEHDGAGTRIRLDRVEGRKVGELNDKSRAIYVAAIDQAVLPRLDETEESLAMIANAILDDDLNPELAKRARLPNH